MKNIALRHQKKPGRKTADMLSTELVNILHAYGQIPEHYRRQARALSNNFYLAIERMEFLAATGIYPFRIMHMVAKQRPLISAHINTRSADYEEKRGRLMNSLRNLYENGATVIGAYAEISIIDLTDRLGLEDYCQYLIRAPITLDAMDTPDFCDTLAVWTKTLGTLPSDFACIPPLSASGDRMIFKRNEALVQWGD